MKKRAMNAQRSPGAEDFLKKLNFCVDKAGVLC